MRNGRRWLGHPRGLATGDRLKLASGRFSNRSHASRRRSVACRRTWPGPVVAAVRRQPDVGPQCDGDAGRRAIGRGPFVRQNPFEPSDAAPAAAAHRRRPRRLPVRRPVRRPVHRRPAGRCRYVRVDVCRLLRLPNYRRTTCAYSSFGSKHSNRSRNS